MPSPIAKGIIASGVKFRSDSIFPRIFWPLMDKEDVCSLRRAVYTTLVFGTESPPRKFWR